MGIYATNRPLGAGMSNAPPNHFAKKFFSPITQHPKTPKRPSVERCRFWTANRRLKNFSSRKMAKLRLWTSPHRPGDPLSSWRIYTERSGISPGGAGGTFFERSNTRRAECRRHLPEKKMRWRRRCPPVLLDK